MVFYRNCGGGECSGFFLRQRPLAEVTNRNDIDYLPSVVHMIKHDVVPNYEPPQIRIDPFQEASPQARMFGQGFDSVE